MTGVNTKLKASDFFYKCLDGSISEDDFDFSKPNQIEKSVKGYVRKKLHVFPQIGDILHDGVLAEEQFSKGRIFCSFATATGKLTIGFIAPGKSRPKTLLSGNHLNNLEKVDIILRRDKKTELFTDLILGNTTDLSRNMPSIENLVSDTIKELANK